MKNNLRFISAAAFFVIVVATVGTGMLILIPGCGQNAQQDKLDRFTANNAEFVVDESFKPIVDEELYIFKASYTGVQPKIAYAPENDLVNLLMNVSARVVILSRDLNKQEYSALLKSRNLRPVVERFAVDAITLIVNQASNDTTITVSEIKKMLNGDTKTDKNIVFDNPNSSLVRYLKDFAGSKEFKQKNIYSLKSNKEVIKYVSEHPDAIGITGFSWLNDPDKDYADAVQKIKIVAVKDDTGKHPSQQYYTPSQNTLALKQYPLTRNLYILNCTGKYGLGAEFANFTKSDRGQRIILKSGLLPDEIPEREITVEQKIRQ
jgi:phosphate transport system substrate-binding protein